MGKFERGNRGRRDFGGRGFAGRDGGRPTMHQAVCGECGKDCEVPFKPTGSRPIFCSNCFGAQKGGNSSDRPARNNFSRPSFRDGKRPMFDAVCEKCGHDCQVPFQPTPGKPVFCSNCFEKGGSTGGRNTEHYKEQFEIINAKLEKIMKALSIGSSSLVIEEKVEKASEEKNKKKQKAFSSKKIVAKKKIAKKKK
ncbi:MAG TPA: CxxC-x17-CxxC domain-containing protein [Patescibacteria group bacterium]|nr:CxxC-x17-CxxC domain-containing protein [Patescibacteria group bacterium]